MSALATNGPPCSDTAAVSSPAAMRRSQPSASATVSVVAAPARKLMAGLAHHQGAEIAHLPHFLAERQELVGRQQAAARVAPAGQGLEPRESPGREAHDGLVEGHDFVAPHGAAQIALQSQPRQPVAFEASAVGGRSASPTSLGGLDRQFGPAQQFGSLGGVLAA